MTKNVNYLSQKKSKEVVNGSPKLPLATDLSDGELAINYAKGFETIAIKNESGDVVTFSSDINFYKKTETSGKTEIENALTSKQNILESGVNIKTINNTSILGSGNITIEGGSGSSGGFTPLTNPTDNTKIGLVNSLSEYYDTNIGNHAVIEGDGYTNNENTYNINASGNFAHAEGNSTIASGACSHAEGDSTVASGDSSHAEGSYTTASGVFSHAEGNSTKAIGESSHAEGNYTIASGYSSHAEGESTEADGWYSHAEGYSTTASSNMSHAEGYDTTASGLYSHAEGDSTVASGESSHAEGAGTQANNMFEHASGQYNVSSKANNTFGNSGNTLFSVGNGTADDARHNAFEIRQNGDIYIVKNGTDVKLQDQLGGSGGTYITVNADWDELDEEDPSFIQNKPFGESFEVVNIYTNPSKGLQQCGQHCFGDMMGGLYLSENLIEGDVYTVDINGNEMDFTASTFNDTGALNWNGDPSTVETVAVFKLNTGGGSGYCISINDSLLNGNTSTASISITRKGNSIKKLDNKFVNYSGSTYIQSLVTRIEDLEDGGGTVVAGGFKVEENPTVSGQKGLVNKLSQYYDTNIGNHAVIEGDGYTGSESTYNIEASGNYSHAEGGATIAKGVASHAEGESTKANGLYSHAEGNSTTASGSSSHAEGNNTKAIGNMSHAEGASTKANGESSHAEGSHTTASGYYSHAEGQNTVASGSSSHAEGYRTIANNISEHASGQFNVSSKANNTFGNSGNTLFSVGNGTSDSARHNAFEIRQNGDIYITKNGSDVKLQDQLGGGSSTNIVILSQSEYDALANKDNNTIYVIK